MSRRRTHRPRGLARVALLLAVALLLGSCSQPGDDGYRVVAEFPQAVSLFEGSRVKVMGVDVGTVDLVEVAGDRIRVEMLIDQEVPLPTDVIAAIVPLSLIGERNVVLAPAWQPGDERIEDGHVVGLDRTRVPVEPDEALQALTDLAQAIDPVEVERLVTSAAGAVEGRGEQINGLLERTAGLTDTLAEQDDELVALAVRLGELAAALTSREAQLDQTLGTYTEATAVLAAERDHVEAFLAALAQLSTSGDDLLSTYQEQLPQDLAATARLLAVLETDIASLQEFAQGIPDVTDTVFRAHRPDEDGLQLRFNGQTTAGVEGVVSSTLPTDEGAP